MITLYLFIATAMTGYLFGAPKPKEISELHNSLINIVGGLLWPVLFVLATHVYFKSRKPK